MAACSCITHICLKTQKLEKSLQTENGLQGRQSEIRPKTHGHRKMIVCLSVRTLMFFFLLPKDFQLLAQTMEQVNHHGPGSSAGGASGGGGG